jgi:hypothetical protein
MSLNRAGCQGATIAGRSNRQARLVPPGQSLAVFWTSSISASHTTLRHQMRSVAQRVLLAARSQCGTLGTGDDAEVLVPCRAPRLRVAESHSRSVSLSQSSQSSKESSSPSATTISNDNRKKKATYRSGAFMLTTQSQIQPRCQWFPRTCPLYPTELSENQKAVPDSTMLSSAQRC